MNREPGLDALLPQDMARRAELVGHDKTRMDGVRLLVLALLAGAFIAFGGMLATIVAADAGTMPMGLVRILSGVAFSLGLILVVVGGAELFTGNNLMVMAWAGGKTTFASMIVAWAIVYVGNFIGSVATAALVFLSGLHQLDGGTVGAAALATLKLKAELPSSVALYKGILANVLVCLAVWLSYGAHSTTDKILAIVPPVAAFVAAGFEHSIANMYLIPFGLLIVDFADPAFWTAIGHGPADFAGIGWSALIHNLVPVTIGNIIGGGVLVGAVYWFVYLHKSNADAKEEK